MLSDAGSGRAQLLRMAMALTVWLALGCGPKSDKLPTYMRPELLYLNDQPYGRLYVEVDTIEGVEVPAELLDGLRAFLTEHCSKPDGVEIVRDKPIPISEVKDVSMGAASVLCLDGPDPNTGPQPAYLHLFFYDTDKVFRRTLKYPHVPGLCPSAICYNVGYCRTRQEEVADFALKHEAGHILGLSKDTSHGDGAHCTNHGCRMNASPGLWSGFFGLLLGLSIDRKLCADCRDDLRQWRSEEVGPGLQFKGPFLIRREDGYSVASLPSRHILMPKSLADDFRWREELTRLKESIRAADSSECLRNPACRHFYLWRYPPQHDSRQTMIEHTAMLTEATKDPSPYISREAAAALARLKQKQTE